MSRTMKAEEAIRALAFLSNPEQLTTSPDSSLLLESNNIRDDSFGDGFRASLTRSLTKLLSEKSLDLYAMADKGNNTQNHTLSKSTSGPQTAATSTTNTPDSSEDTGSSDYSATNSKGVSFGTVEVRKYPITIGANPSVSRGVPRTIEWDHLEDETECHHINAYERERPNEERKRGEELLLDGLTRAKMLQNLGYTKTQLFEGIRKAKEYRLGFILMGTKEKDQAMHNNTQGDQVGTER